MNCVNGIIFTWFRRCFAASRDDFGDMTMNYGEMKRKASELSVRFSDFASKAPAMSKQARWSKATKLYHEFCKFSRDCAKLSPKVSFAFLEAAGGVKLFLFSDAAMPKSVTRSTAKTPSRTPYKPRRGHRIRTKEIRLNDPQKRGC